MRMIDVSFESINYRLHICIPTSTTWIWFKTDKVTLEGVYREMLQWELDFGMDCPAYGYAISHTRCWRSPQPAEAPNKYSLDSCKVEVPFHRNVSPDALYALRYEILSFERKTTG